MRDAPLQRTRHHFYYSFYAFGGIVWNVNPTTVGFLFDPRDQRLNEHDRL